MNEENIWGKFTFMDAISQSQRKLSHDIKLRTLKVINVLLMTAVFAAVWYFFLQSRIASPFYNKGNWLVIFIYLLLYAILGRTYDAFLVSYNRISDMVYSQCLAALIANFLLYIVTWLLEKHLPNVLLFLMIFGAQILIAVLWSTLAHRWYFKTFPPKRTFIVWDMRKGMTDLIHEYGMNQKFNVVGNCRASECIDHLDCLDGMEAVFLTGVHSHDRNVIIKYCVEHHIASFIIPRIGDVMMSGAKRMHMFHLPILRLERYRPTPEYLFFKRLFDIVFALIGLVITSPVILVVSILIKKYDGGPVFYRQCRLTKDGKEFDVLKFRSMRVDAEKDGVARLSTGDADPRITPIGRSIRKVRIDELPQFINILKGDMSFVGPRPERPEIAKQYEEDLPEFRLRLQAKCGLTGYAQVFGKYNTTPYDKLQLDLMYIANPSLVQDLRIIFATIKILFMKESTEGVAEGQTTAEAGKPEIEESVGQESERKTV
ncbi:MAG: sugar transferase [Catenisphaera adipataccumulans]|uniref:sugar transferase n=1 Tax=Catenisphaera adipataccumulans TaxID=700500 RepID=UPI003D917D56